MDPLLKTLEDELRFLSELYRERIYCGLKKAGSALATTTLVLQNSGTIGNCPFVMERVWFLIKGVFEAKPSLPRYSETWDMNVVLKYLSGLGQLEDLNCKKLALLTRQRCLTLHAFDVTAMQFRPEDYHAVKA